MWPDFFLIFFFCLSFWDTNFYDLNLDCFFSDNLYILIILFVDSE